MSKFLFPGAMLAWVLTLAFVLIYVVVLTSPDTHLHLGELAAHQGHLDERAALIFISSGSPGAAPTEGIGAEIVHHLQVPSGEAVEAGRLIFSAAGCVRCHGIDGRGSVVGPSLAGASSDVVKHMVRDGGPGGMPPYSTDKLSDTDLADLVMYLRGLEVVMPRSEEIAAIQRLTWDPSISSSVLLQGKAAIRRSCGACHTQPTKEEIRSAFTNDFDATSLVADMAGRQTSLSLQDARAIAYYMMAVLHGADPARER